MSGAPLVSVIVPAFRAAPTVGRAVRSLLAQTLADWQAIIVSDDEADYRAVLAAEGIADPRLVFVATGGDPVREAEAFFGATESIRG